MKKQKTDFKLIGLSKPNSVSCKPLHNENYFSAPTNLSQDRFDALFNYSKGHWKDDEMIAEIEHNGLNKDETPINPTLVAVRIVIS